MPPALSSPALSVSFQFRIAPYADEASHAYGRRTACFESLQTMHQTLRWSRPKNWILILFSWKSPLRMVNVRSAAQKTLPHSIGGWRNAISRPSPQAYLDIIQDAKEKDEEVLILTISGGLSGTVESAHEAKRMSGYDRVCIVDTHQAIIAQRLLVEMAVRLRDEGYSAQEIARRIEHSRDKVVVCGVVDTLKYLRKGGRIPAGLAAIGSILNIKPVIVLEDTKLKTMGKARGYTQGVKMLYQRMKQDQCSKAYPVYFGYTTNRELGLSLLQKTKETFGLNCVKLHPVGGVIGTHCGTDCVAIAYVKGL